MCKFRGLKPCCVPFCIDKTDFWVFVEEEDPYLGYEELENAIYGEAAYPASAKPSSNTEG